MKWDRSILQTGKLPLRFLFLTGFVTGLCAVYFARGILLEDAGMLDEDMLYRMKYMTVDSNALFCYVFRKRMEVLILLAVLSTTYLGYVACMGAAVWCGMSSGIFLATLTVRYGIKGIVLAIISMFPQYLFYIPAIIMMLGWGEDLYRAIYSRGLNIHVADKTFVVKKLGWLGVIAFLTFLGCVMEGYVNPGILIGYLKVF